MLSKMEWRKTTTKTFPVNLDRSMTRVVAFIIADKARSRGEERAKLKHLSCAKSREEYIKGIPELKAVRAFCGV